MRAPRARKARGWVPVEPTGYSPPFVSFLGQAVERLALHEAERWQGMGDRAIWLGAHPSASVAAEAIARVIEAAGPARASG
jgi:hypothetical protein